MKRILKKLKFPAPKRVDRFLFARRMAVSPAKLARLDPEEDVRLKSMAVTLRVENDYSTHS